MKSYRIDEYQIADLGSPGPVLEKKPDAAVMREGFQKVQVSVPDQPIPRTTKVIFPWAPMGRREVGPKGDGDTYA